MNRIQVENINLNNSQSKSNNSDNFSSFSQNSRGSQERMTEIQNFLSQNETPLSTKGNVKSYCRIRPNDSLFSCINKFKIENNNRTLWVDFTPDVDKNNPSKQNYVKYNFTEIFGANTPNIEIYQKVCKENIDQIFSNHRNALIFVYGITNSGKTYTISGDLKNPGILQYSLFFLFEEFQKLKCHNNFWQLTCTYIEIYNEEIYDLLSKDRQKLKICGTSSNKFHPLGAITKNIECPKDFSKVLEFGELNRSKGETNSNHNSSRSHSIFRAELSYKGNITKNKVLPEPISLCIVDLAGAERVSKSGVSGNGLKEAGNINTSLLCLKKCFDAMEANSKVNCAEKKVIVPVRESKLTLLFKEYFAAHQNISVICTINPDKNEINDIKSVLNFGSHAMRVKTMKSWIQTNYNSRDVSPNKNKNKDNYKDNYKDQKRFRMYTNKKYLDKNYNSKEKDNKCREEFYSNDSSFSKKKNNFYSSDKKTQNIKLIKNKKNEQNYSENKINKNIINDENSNNNSYINLEERKKCTTNPFQFLSTNNFHVKISPNKEKEKYEQKIKEKQEEIKENVSKKGDEIKHAFLDFLKKVYYDNLKHNIEIYKAQCRNIDTKELEILLLKKNNNTYSFGNPFIKTYEEDKKIFSKNLKICGDNSLVFAPELDVTRNSNQIMEDLLQIKLNNSNEHDITKIHDYLDRSFEQYQTSKFKAYFGIGESLIKKMEDDKKLKKKENKEKFVDKFNSLNNDIEMADKVNNIENTINEVINNDSMFSNEFNYKRKGKNKNEKHEKNENNENQNNQNQNKDEKVNNRNISTNTNDEQLDVKSDIDTDIEFEKNKKNKEKRKKSKKRAKSKKKEIIEEEITGKDNENSKDKNRQSKEKDEEIEDNNDNNNDNEKEESDVSKKKIKKYPKSKKKNKKDRSKKTSKSKSIDSNDDTSEDDIIIIPNKKNRKNKKNKKKKIESDNDSDDTSLSDDNINIKPPRKKKGKSKRK